MWEITDQALSIHVHVAEWAWQEVYEIVREIRERYYTTRERWCNCINKSHIDNCHPLVCICGHVCKGCAHESIHMHKDVWTRMFVCICVYVWTCTQRLIYTCIRMCEPAWRGVWNVNKGCAHESIHMHYGLWTSMTCGTQFMYRLSIYVKRK